MKPGKHYYKWIETRKQWFKQNPAENYTCYICGKWLPIEETTLDHIKNRSGHPELRYVLSNLAPCCWECNSKKGSKSIDNI